MGRATRRGRHCVAIGATLVLIGASVRAEVADFSLEYLAPLGCPTESDFMRGVANRTTHARRVTSSERAISVRVEASASGDVSFRGEVTLVDGGEESMRRLVAGPSCADVVGALELIVAMSLEGAPLDESKDRGDASSAVIDVAPAPSSPSTASAIAPAPRVVAPAPQSSSSQVGPVVRPTPVRPRWRSSIALGGGISTDLVSGPAPVAALAYEGRLERGKSVFAPGVKFQVTYASGEAPVGDGRTVVVRAGALDVDGCPFRWQVGGGAFAASPCVTGEFGGRFAEVSPDHAGVAAFPYLGLGGKVVLALDVTDVVFVELEGAALAPLLKRRLFAGDAEPAVFSPPSIGFRAGLAIGVSFP